MPTASVNQKSDALSNVERAAQVFDKYGDFIRTGIRFHVKDKMEVEDLFQDLFLLLVAKPIPQDVQNVEGFLYRVITQSVKDAFRRIDRYQARIRRYAERNVHAIKKRPENVIMDIEEAENMFELIEKRLPRPQALALTWKYKHNCDTEEVAERMRVKPRSVSKYASVGLEKMRHLLGDKQKSSI
ncbi:MAG: sigma-70 family RNA polymerase sigma factor [Planctomycetota bacterium]|jgi:RNA polymerase sigma factor (sigma-70 family)